MRALKHFIRIKQDKISWNVQTCKIVTTKTSFLLNFINTITYANISPANENMMLLLFIIL